MKYMNTQEGFQVISKLTVSVLINLSVRHRTPHFTNRESEVYDIIFLTATLVSAICPYFPSIAGVENTRHCHFKGG